MENIINGKAKIEFENWYYKKFPNELDVKIVLFALENKSETEKNALIIEWLSTLKYKGQDLYIYCFDFFYKHRIESQTINDINLQAITKAVETFNLI